MLPVPDLQKAGVQRYRYTLNLLFLVLPVHDLQWQWAGAEHQDPELPRLDERLPGHPDLPTVQLNTKYMVT